MSTLKCSSAPFWESSSWARGLDSWKGKNMKWTQQGDSWPRPEQTKISKGILCSSLLHPPWLQWNPSLWTWTWESASRETGFRCCCLCCSGASATLGFKKPPGSQHPKVSCSVQNTSPSILSSESQGISAGKQKIESDRNWDYRHRLSRRVYNRGSGPTKSYFAADPRMPPLFQVKHALSSKGSRKGFSFLIFLRSHGLFKST